MTGTSSWKVQNRENFRSWIRSNWFFSVIKQFFWLEEARLLSIMNEIVVTIPNSVLYTKVGDLLSASLSGEVKSQEGRLALQQLSTTYVIRLSQMVEKYVLA